MANIKDSLKCPLCFPHLIPLPEDEDRDLMMEVTAFEHTTFKAICRIHGRFSWDAVNQRWEKEEGRR